MRYIHAHRNILVNWYYKKYFVLHAYTQIINTFHAAETFLKVFSNSIKIANLCPWVNTRKLAKNDFFL